MSDKTLMLRLKISVIDPGRSFSLKELGIDLSELPNDLRSMAREAVYPKDVLKPLNRLRKELDRELEKYGTKKDGEWVFNPDDTEIICNIIVKVQDEYLDHKKYAVTNHDTIIAQQLSELRKMYQNYEHVEVLIKAIEKVQPTKDYVDSQIDFTFILREVGELTNIDPRLDTVVNKGLREYKQGLYGATLESVSKKANELLNTLFNDAKVKPAKIKATVTLQEKVNRLSFLDKRLIPLANGMKKILSNIPLDKGSIPLSGLGEYSTLLTLLSNKQRLLDRLENNQPLIFKQEEVDGVMLNVPGKTETEKQATTPSKAAKTKPVTTRVKRTGVPAAQKPKLTSGALRLA